MIKFHKTCEPEVLQFDKITIVEPRKTEVLFKVEILSYQQTDYKYPFLK